MYKSWWGLKEKPFLNTPDPRYFYYSSSHEEALSRLLYLVSQRLGAGLLTGVFGCGKTVVAQTFIEKLKERGNYKVAFIKNPILDHIELLRSIASHLDIKGLPEKKTEILKDFLLEKLEQALQDNLSDGKETIVIIDEAHIINDLLIFEELRLLLNFQLRDRFLLTLILLGQPELKKTIDAIKQLSQRIIIRYHLTHLSLEETKAYIKHRLNVAGCKREIFEEEALRSIYDYSGGIPRRINNICDMSLFIAFGERLSVVPAQVIKETVKDLEI